MNKIDAKMGGSMVYVMVLITFLGILSTGFLYMTEYSRRSAMNNRAYIEAQTTARSIHQSFCEAVSSRTSEAMDTLWSCFEEDCDTVREEYEAAAGDEEAGDDEQEEDAGDGPLTEEDDEQEAVGDGPLTEEDSGAVSEDPGGGTEDHASPWETFLRSRLEEKAYVTRGHTELSERVSVSITLTAYPLKNKATVSTTVACNGYRFSMNGDILFNNMDGDMLDLGEGLSICMEGSGVYRYYGD